MVANDSPNALYLRVNVRACSPFAAGCMSCMRIFVVNHSDEYCVFFNKSILFINLTL